MGKQIKQKQERDIPMDITLHFREKGAGDPLVLLHGNGENSDYFVHQTDFFSGHYRVIAVDTRGHGKSPRGTAPFTIAQFADDLNAFMSSLNIPRATILGFSDGANIAMRFAIHYPDRVRALILNGGNLNAKGVKSSVQFPIEIGYSMTRLFAKKSADANAKMELLGLMVNEPNLSVPELQGITAPTLVIAGTKDLIKQSHTELIAASIPNSKLAFVEGNHFVANKNPEEFNRVVEGFLRDIPPRY